jgi:outer membrane biosynthesis protein TonB
MKTLRRILLNLSSGILLGILLITCFSYEYQFSRIEAQEMNSNLAKLPETKNCSQEDDFLDCSSKYNPLKVTTGELKWLELDELKKLAKKTSKPKPAHAKGTTIATVEIIIDTKGEVVCSRVTSGHPLVRVAALNAVKKWKFNPYIIDTKPTAIAGRISFKFEGEKVSF